MPNVQTLCPVCNHYYDSSESACPYCNPPADIDNGNEVVCPKCGHAYDSSLTECPYCSETPSPEPEPIENDTEDDEGTTILYRPENVTGWLVCTAGNDKGRDFRLHADNNFVGRNTDQDVCLNDKGVSRHRHFSVVCDAENDDYFVMSGGGKGLVRVNGMPVGGHTPLTKGDKIRVGDTTLVFIPLETAYVKWD